MRYCTLFIGSFACTAGAFAQFGGGLSVGSGTPAGSLCFGGRVTRLNNAAPIIDAAMFAALGADPSEGDNINGPSLIRVPDWIAPQDRADPSALYYLYFAHHRGDYIRLAWAADIQGPWHLFGVGSQVPVGARGVLDLGVTDQINLANGLDIHCHVASPEVLVDDVNQRIVMYFHAPTRHNGVDLGQKTFVATSGDGLSFLTGIKPVILGRFYFRIFSYGGELYAIANEGELYQALDPTDPWTPPPGFDFSQELWIQRPDNIFQQRLDDAGTGMVLRHSAVIRTGTRLRIIHSRKFDAPERILISTMDLRSGDMFSWTPSFPPAEVMTAEPGWEGGELMVVPSRRGPAPEDVHQLRDPAVFQDTDGTRYLLYAGRGEDAIGLARLELVRPALHSGDINADGQLDTIDALQLQACLTGPICDTTPCVTPAYQGACCGVMDTDADGDVDLLDISIEMTAVTP